jgi:hypothetical protein
VGGLGGGTETRERTSKRQPAMLAHALVLGFKVSHMKTNVVRQAPLFFSIQPACQQFVLLERLNQFYRYPAIPCSHVSDVGTLQLMPSSQKPDFREKGPERFNALRGIPHQVGQMIKRHGGTEKLFQDGLGDGLEFHLQAVWQPRAG